MDLIHIDFYSALTFIIILPYSHLTDNLVSTLADFHLRTSHNNCCWHCSHNILKHVQLSSYREGLKNTLIFGLCLWSDPWLRSFGRTFVNYEVIFYPTMNKKNVRIHMRSVRVISFILVQNTRNKNCGNDKCLCPMKSCYY